MVCIDGNMNGTRCRDGVKVLWCHSHLVWLVFEASIPTCACFHSENFFCDLFLLFFFFVFVCVCVCVCVCVLFRNGKREERWEGMPRGRCMVYKV